MNGQRFSAFIAVLLGAVIAGASFGYGGKLTRIGIPRLSSNDEISRSILHQIASLWIASAIAFSTARENGYLTGIAAPKASNH